MGATGIAEAGLGEDRRISAAASIGCLIWVSALVWDNG